MRGVAAGKGYSGMKAAGLIAAAGRSRRMDGFKPLLPVNGFPMIVMTVQSMRNAGIRDITVVTGYRGEDVRRALEGMDVRIVENSRWGETDMLASVRLGLAAADTGRGVFFLPGDMPLVSPGSFRRLEEQAAVQPPEVSALIPVRGSRQLHPPFLFPEGCRRVLAYRGERGLAGALASMHAAVVEIEDDGAEMDADNRTELELVRAGARACRGISGELCREFYDEVALPEHIRAHCLAVGELAARMAETLVRAGAFLDIELCRSAGYLHDLLRLTPDHEKAVETFLKARGYRALAETAGAHRGFVREPETVCREEVLVCLADKLILEDRRVTLEQRYRKALEKRPVKDRILRDIGICRRLIGEYEVITGERL